jgi:hypothetical protein
MNPAVFGEMGWGYFDWLICIVLKAFSAVFHV